MSSDPVDEYTLENIVDDNGIHVGVFLPFTITRLRETTDTALEAVLVVDLRNIVEEGEKQKSLRLKWSGQSVSEDSLPVQEGVVTEWAACGIASVLVPLYAEMRITHVAQEGDRFDYWVGDGGQEYALEVSGTVRANLEHRHLAKVRQLRGNPYGVDGFVAVTRFLSRETIFSFHRLEVEAE